MPSTPESALLAAFTKTLSLWKSELTGPNQVIYNVISSPDLDGVRTVDMLKSDFLESSIQNQTEITLDGERYLVRLKDAKDAGFYPTENLTIHLNSPTIRVNLTKIQ